ncbi:MAG: hypothetical protein AOA65_1508 [Candidatus Bathyarchaeota archaeon BA1]|nr:MAG: hypothetical protein AOA65_1508 [Candidatus Bathyarchaeota archaeon BA1]
MAHTRALICKPYLSLCLLSIADDVKKFSALIKYGAVNMPRQRRVKSYLLPECNIEYARGICQGEGTIACTVLHEKREPD